MSRVAPTLACLALTIAAVGLVLSPSWTELALLLLIAAVVVNAVRLEESQRVLAVAIDELYEHLEHLLRALDEDEAPR